MADRRKTPDILGDLLGGGRRPSPKMDTKSSVAVGDKPHKPDVDVHKLPASKSPHAQKDDIEYYEFLLESATSALVLIAEVLGKRRLVKWLNEMREFFGEEDGVDFKRAAGEAFIQSAATWAKRHLGAETVTTHSSAQGLNAPNPYEVDICAHFKGERFRNAFDMWIDCHDENTPITRKEVSNLVQKATDVFRGAQAEGKGFFFDRITLVSAGEFEPDAIRLADQLGLVCVQYDGTSYTIMTEENWKLQPRWLKEAEYAKDFSQ